MTQGKRGIVMVAESNALVRREVMGDLRKAGYTPVGCRDTTGALTYLALGERLDALVTGSGDLGDNEGVDLAREAMAARPRLSVIYLSDRHPGEDRMVPDGRFVRIPFQTGQVTAAVTERLAER
jgi:DNA-binding response OmpR family regulator